jgi:quinol monooxygenase YgiN
MTEPHDVTASRAWEPGLRSISEPGVPVFMNVTLTINPERLEQFLAALRGVLPAARAEPTCIYLHAGQSVTESNVFILSEGWRDLVEYRDVILHKPYFQAYLQISESTYAKPRVTQPLIPVQTDS